MIRDPSDGSVREKSAPVQKATHNSGEGDPSVMPDCAGADTGIALPHAIGMTVSGLAPEVTDLAQRLKSSRAWLAEYHARKGTA